MFHDETKENSASAEITSKTSFAAGFAGGVLAFCATAFFVFLILAFKGLIKFNG